MMPLLQLEALQPAQQATHTGLLLVQQHSSYHPMPGQMHALALH
jgi:hypothetical protein